MDRFADCYGDLGLTTGVIGTCYALAENVFAVTQSPPGESARGEPVDVVSGPGGLWAELVPLEAGGSIASSGRVLPGIRLRVDARNRPQTEKLVKSGSPTRPCWILTRTAIVPGRFRGIVGTRLYERW